MKGNLISCTDNIIIEKDIFKLFVLFQISILFILLIESFIKENVELHYLLYHNQGIYIMSARYRLWWHCSFPRNFFSPPFVTVVLASCTRGSSYWPNNITHRLSVKWRSRHRASPTHRSALRDFHSLHFCFCFFFLKSNVMCRPRGSDKMTNVSLVTSHGNTFN